MNYYKNITIYAIIAFGIMKLEKAGIKMQFKQPRIRNKHKASGKQYLTMMFITDATKSAKAIKIPKWVRFPALILAVMLVWKSLDIYSYVESLEAQLAHQQVAVQEEVIDREAKEARIAELENELASSVTMRYEKLEELKSLAIELGIKIEDLEAYREEMEEFKSEIDTNLGTYNAPKSSDSDESSDVTRDLLKEYTLQIDPNYENKRVLSTSAPTSEGSADLTTIKEEQLKILDATMNDTEIDEAKFEAEFDAELDKITAFLEFASSKVEQDSKNFAITNESLEEMIPYLESYPSVWPIKNTYVTSAFGYRRNPFGGSGREFHTGVDLKARYQDVSATAEGEVVVSEYLSGYGYTIVIDHGYGLTTKYAHNSKLYVSVGDHVERGDVISESGNSGRSTGPHLHYEVLLNGEPVNPVDYIY
jgi:murein DD-endopeptidase MepM/ murein hydrolase activator NlpD